MIFPLSKGGQEHETNHYHVGLAPKVWDRDLDGRLSTASTGCDGQSVPIHRREFYRRKPMWLLWRRARVAVFHSPKRVVWFTQNRWKGLRRRKNLLIKRVQQKVLQGELASRIKEHIERKLFKQRCGIVRILRSTRNIAGVFLGGWMAFASGTTNNELSLAVQCGMQAWMLTNKCLVDNSLPLESNPRSSTHDSHENLDRRTIRRSHQNQINHDLVTSDGNRKPISQRPNCVANVAKREDRMVAREPMSMSVILHNVMFRDSLAAAVFLLAFFALQKRSENSCTVVLRIVVPMIGIFRVTMRSFHCIVENMHRQETVRKSVLYKVLLRKRQSFVDGISSVQRQLLGSVVGILVVATIRCIPMHAHLFTLIAASLMGITLVADSLLDEFVNNWFDLLLRRLGPDQRRVARQYLYDHFHGSLRCHFLHPVKELFEEMGILRKEAIRVSTDGLSTSSDIVVVEETPRNGKSTAVSLLRDRVTEAIMNSYELQMIWTVAFFGVMFQLFVLYREPIAFHIKHALSAWHR